MSGTDVTRPADAPAAEAIDRRRMAERLAVDAEPPAADAEPGPADAEPQAADAEPQAADAEPGPDGADASLLDLIDRLTAILERSDLTELEVEAGGTALVLRKAEALLQPVALQPHRAAPGGTQADPAALAVSPDGVSTAPSRATPAGPSATAVLAPLTGIYYTAATPTSPPFVKVGQEIVAGQVIGLIEAMKLFNEIKSDKDGRVVRMVAENGSLVKAKQPLIEVEPL